MEGAEKEKDREWVGWDGWVGRRRGDGMERVGKNVTGFSAIK